MLVLEVQHPAQPVINFLRKSFEFMEIEELKVIIDALMSEWGTTREEALLHSIQMLSWLIETRSELVEHCLQCAPVTGETLKRWPPRCSKFFREKLWKLIREEGTNG
jgi:hypothetical protein